MWITLKSQQWISINERGDVVVCRNFDRVSKRPSVDRRGVKYINVDGRTRYIHRLVASLFVPNPKRCRYVEFKDGHPSNTASSNLRWTNEVPRRASVGRVLRPGDVTVIRALLARHDSHVEIARRFGVDKSLISHINAGRRWASV